MKAVPGTYYFLGFLFLQGYTVHNCIIHNQQTVSNSFVSQYLCVFFMFTIVHSFQTVVRNSGDWSMLLSIIYVIWNAIPKKISIPMDHFSDNQVYIYGWKFKGVCFLFLFLFFYFERLLITKGQFSNSARNKNCSEIPWGTRIQKWIWYARI